MEGKLLWPARIEERLPGAPSIQGHLDHGWELAISVGLKLDLSAAVPCLVLSNGRARAAFRLSREGCFARSFN